jgi:hypothetical protein
MSSIFDSDIRDPDTSIEIQKYLKYFGLENFDLNGDWYSQFIYFIKNKYEIPSISITSDKKKYKYKSISKKEIKFIKYYKLTDDTACGTYNDIIKCKDIMKDNYVVMRISRIEKTDSDNELDKESYEKNYENDLFSSFLDNLKYIILYIYCKCYIKPKIMPDIYLFGYDYKYKKFYMIMEYIDYQFDSYINDNFKGNLSSINDSFCKIFKILELLNDSGLKFKHSDLKYNNILIDKSGDPLLIDFGLASFVLPNSNIIFEPDILNNNTILNYHYKYTELDCLILDKLNITHDMILLIASCYYVKCIKTSMDFKKLMNSKICDTKCIINGMEIHRYIENFFKISSKDEFISSNCKNKFYFDNYSSIDIYRDVLNGFIDRKLLIIIYHDDLVKYINI